MTKKRVTRTTASSKKRLPPPHVYIKPRTRADGTVEETWVVRKRVTINGRRQPFEKTCLTNSITDYKDKLKLVDQEIDEAINGSAKLAHSDRTFGELADYFEKWHLIPAKFSNGKKRNRGRRKTYTPLLYLTGYGTPLKEGEKRKPLKGPNLGWRTLIGDSTKLNSISGRRLAELKEELFDHPVKTGSIERDRSFTDVNRRFEVLRKMFSVARIDLDLGDQERTPWMSRNPFKESTVALIERDNEVKRLRVMGPEEEEALLKVADERRRCSRCKQVDPSESCPEKKHNGGRTKDREHLRLVIIGLVDTCMRSAEFFRLTVRDWKDNKDHVRVQQWTTKTLKEREAPAPDRFVVEMEDWIKRNNLQDDDWLLTRRSARTMDTDKNKEGMTDHVASVRTAWKTALKMTGIKDLRIRDLRRTGATRLLRDGMPLAEISQILGHTDIKMTMKYIGVDKTSMTRANERLNNIHAKHAAQLAARDAAMAVN